MKTCITFAIALIALLATTAMAAQFVITLNPSSNVILIGETNNCGGCSRLAVSSANISSLIRFDLSGLPADAVIDNVFLDLFIAATGSGSPQLQIYPADGPWANAVTGGSSTDPTEGDLAFDAEPTFINRVSNPVSEWTTAGGINATAGYLFQFPITDNTPSFDIDGYNSENFTALVQRWKNSASNNHGIAVKVRSGTTGTVLLGSRTNTNAALRPALRVTYTSAQTSVPVPITPQNFANPPGLLGRSVPSRYTASSTTGAIVGGVIAGVVLIIVLISVGTILLRS